MDVCSEEQLQVDLSVQYMVTFRKSEQFVYSCIENLSQGCNPLCELGRVVSLKAQLI